MVSDGIAVATSVATGWCNTWAVGNCVKKMAGISQGSVATHLTFDGIFIGGLVRPHRNTTYVDAAYSHRPSSVVCLSVCHTSEPCKNGCTDRAAVWVEDLGGPGEPRIRWGSRFPHGKGQIFGGEWASNCKV